MYSSYTHVHVHTHTHAHTHITHTHTHTHTHTLHTHTLHTHTHTHTHTQNSLDTEYTPGDTPGTSRDRATKIGVGSDSDEEMAEDWEAELVETRTSRKPWAERDHGQRTETAHMQRCVVPTSYERYQNTVQET